MNSPARTSPHRKPTFDYLRLSPKIRKPKWTEDESSSSDQTDHSYYPTFGNPCTRPTEEPPVDDLDETMAYEFQDGQAVWVRTDDDEWVRGQIAGKRTRVARTRVADGRFFPVAFGQSGRRYYSPLNGDVKPDTTRVRELLREGGYL